MLQSIIDNFGAKPAKTVDGVLAVFNQTILDLEEVQREQQANAAAAEQARIEAAQKRDEHDAEANRARIIADQIRALVVPASA